jgi:hypothetical protein
MHHYSHTAAVPTSGSAMTMDVLAHAAAVAAAAPGVGVGSPPHPAEQQVGAGG